jgi:eukaryotic-like serine/threonine-protein kinase
LSTRLHQTPCDAGNAITELRHQLQAALGTVYSIERELGGGGMSRVFLASEISLDRKIVLKVLPPSLAAAVMLDRFRREIQLAAQLQHPHILPLFSAGEVEGVPYFTMPFVSGESLRTRLGAGGVLPISDTIRILREVASALAYAHQSGIVHRDIKPDNVLLSHGSAIVMDFGVAKAILAATRLAEDPLTSEGYAIGTPAYMSPEQAVGDPDIDHRSDIYSLGVMAYEMLAGAAPFAGKSRQAMLAAHILEKPASIATRRADIPAALAKLVMDCLQKEPRDRPQNASELVSALDTTTSGENAAERRRARHQPSIAVLPFVNLSADVENEYFSDGITEEILSALSSVPSLRVAARTSSFAFKGRNLDIGQIAEQLKVDSVLEGSVRRAKNRVKINVQLVNAADGYRLFSEQYDRELEDVFAIQEEIARSVVALLKVKLTGEQDEALGRRHTDNVVAYEHYLRGRHIWNDTRRVESAIPHFEEALKHDPGYALAFHGLADCYCALGLYTLLPPSVVMPLAKTAALRGCELAPELPETQTSLGLFQILDWDWRAAEASLRSALKRNPRHALAHSFLAWVLSTVDRPAEAAVAARSSHELDPLSPVINGIAALVHYHAREYDQAIEHCERVLEMDPMSFIGLFAMSQAYACEGRYEEAIRYSEEGARLSPDSLFLQGLVGVTYAMAGKTGEAREIIAELESRSRKDYVAPILFSRIYAHLGETDRAFEYLDKAFAERSCTLAFGIRSPMYDPLRTDPRFGALMTSLGLS